MRSARSRNVPSSTTTRDNENIENWDAESNHHHHRNDDDEKKYFGDGKKHRYVRYMLNVPMKLGTKRLVALSLVVVLVVLFGLNGMMMMGGGEGNIATMGKQSGTHHRHRQSNHHKSNDDNEDEDDDNDNDDDDNESLDLSGGDEEETNEEGEDNEKEQQTQDDLDSSEQRLEELSVALRKRYAKDINRKGSDLRENNNNNNIKEQRAKNEKELERAAQSGNDRDIASAMLMKLVLDRAESDRDVQVDDGEDDNGKVIKWDAVRAALNARFEAQRQQVLARRERERERKKREEARRAK